MAGLFESEALLFTIPAMLGSMLFLLKLGLLMLGGDADTDVDVDIDLDVDLDPDALDAGTDAAHALGDGDSTSAFTFISIQGIITFIMGFGWGGLIGQITFEWPLAASFGAGLVFGSALMWLLTILLRAVYSLQSSGNIRLRDTVGTGGRIYLTVPANGKGVGRVRLVIQGRARMYYAVTEGDELTTGVRIKVTKANEDNSVTVIPV